MADDMPGADKMSGAEQVSGTLGEAGQTSLGDARQPTAKPSDGRPDAAADKGVAIAAKPASAPTIAQADTPKPATSEKIADGGSANAGGGQSTVALDAVRNIPVTLTVVLGSISLPVSSLMNMQRGETIELKKRVGEPVEILANGKLIGRGEIVVLEEDEPVFAVSLTELASSGPGSSSAK